MASRIWKFVGVDNVKCNEQKPNKNKKESDQKTREKRLTLKERILAYDSDIYELYRELGSMAKLAEYFETTSVHMANVLCDLGYNKNWPSIHATTPDIISNYPISVVDVFLKHKGNLCNMAKEYGISYSSVDKYLRRNDVYFMVVTRVLQVNNITYSELYTKLNGNLKEIANFFSMTTKRFKSRFGDGYVIEPLKA